MSDRLHLVKIRASSTDDNGRSCRAGTGSAEQYLLPPPPAWVQAGQRPGGGRKLGLVLGAGVARGWAHIGVLETLTEMGVHPHIVCGCSSGAIVAAAYAAGRLDVLQARVRKLTLREVFGMLDVSFHGGGLVEGQRVAAFLRDVIGGAAIEDVTPVFGAVAAELTSGRELWLTAGSMVDAVRASISLPGVMTPALLQGRWLIDGALVNPLPVSLCRALGADVIIGVSLNGSLFTPGMRAVRSSEPAGEAGEQSVWLQRLSFGRWGWHGAARMRVRPVRPGYLEVVTQAVFGAQDFIARVRMAADPVDVLIAPAASGIGLLDFHHGAEAIGAGRTATEAMAGAILSAWDAVEHHAAAE